MKRAKKMVGFLMAASIIGTSFSPMVAHAAEKGDVSKNAEVIDVSKNSKNVKVSDRLTYDQLVKEVAKDENLSIAEAKKFLGINDETRARGEFYRTYAVDVNVNYGEYTPTIKFYCKTSEWDSYRGIVQVLNSSLDRTDAYGTSKGFSGTLYTNLENSYTIYYELNGDFLNNETTTHTGGVAIGIGEGSTISFSSSSSSNLYKYVDISDTFDPFNY